MSRGRREPTRTERRSVFRPPRISERQPLHERSPVRPRRRRRLRHRDRRARQGGRRAALSRRGHRGARRQRRRSSRSGACWSTASSSRACRPPSRIRSPSARATRAWTCSPRWRMLGPGVGLRAADRHLRRGRARPARPRVGDGAVVRGPVGARRRPPARAAERGRQGDLDPGAVPDPLARRGRPRPRQGDRRLLDLGRRARHERLHVHRARGRLDRRRRRRRAVGRRRRAVRARCTAARPRAC